MSTLTLYFAATYTFGSDQPNLAMAASMYQINTTQLPRFTFNGDNRLDFLQRFPDVAAVQTFKFYVTPSVHAIIWKRERLTATQYYRRLWDMFLGGDVRAVQSLEAAWYGCAKRSNTTLLAWWARFDALLAELALLGVC